jgi:hypothetical protein
MEGHPAEAPLKVCPHCSVASRTDADTCPSCGKPYGRRGVQLQRPPGWRWWYAIPIVAAAFALGYFGIAKLIDGDDSEGYISVDQAAAVPDDVTPSELKARLDDEQPVDVRPQRGSEDVTCSYYGITGQPRSVWEFCFEGEQLVSSGPLGAPGASTPPQDLPGGAPPP